MLYSVMKSVFNTPVIYGWIAFVGGVFVILGVFKYFTYRMK